MKTAFLVLPHSLLSSQLNSQNHCYAHVPQPPGIEQAPETPALTCSGHMFRINQYSAELRGYQAMDRNDKTQNVNPLRDTCFDILVLTPDLLLKLFIKQKAVKN